MGILNGLPDAYGTLDGVDSRARKAILRIEPGEEKLRRIAVLSLVEPHVRIVTIKVSHPRVEIKPLQHVQESKSTGQSLCPRCGSPVFNLKLLNRNYCFKCKTYT